MNWATILVGFLSVYDELATGGAQAEASKITAAVVPILQELATKQAAPPPA